MSIRKGGGDNRKDERSDQSHEKAGADGHDRVSAYQKNPRAEAHSKESQPEGTSAPEALNDPMPAQADQQNADGKGREMKTADRIGKLELCLLYTSPSPRDRQKSRMPSSA